MIRRFVLGASLIAALALGAVTGCGARSSDGGGEKRVRVGALYLDAQGFYGGIRKGIQVGAASQSLDLIGQNLSLIHISEPTRQEAISYAVFCL